MGFNPGPFTTSINVTDAVSYSDSFKLAGCGILSAVITSATGSDPLTTFKVQFQGAEGGAWVDYLGGSDWSSTTNVNMLFCTTQKPDDLDEDETAGIRIDTRGCYAIRFAATCTTSETATITIAGAVSGVVQ